LIEKEEEEKRGGPRKHGRSRRRIGWREWKKQL
jgi:hypothetical protein